MKNEESAALAAFRQPDGWLIFRRPVHVRLARRIDEVRDTLAGLDHPPTRGGMVCALAYEAAPALDAAFSIRKRCPSPLAVVVEFGNAEIISDSDLNTGAPPPIVFGAWGPEQTREEYGIGYRRIRTELEAGNTYQVNYTHRYRARVLSKPDGESLFALFVRLANRHSAAYAAFIDTPLFSILSISPELFFERAGSRVCSRPMKGTAPRGVGVHEDTRIAEELASSAKERAENLMIVDMIRNDLGRIAEVGSVRVPELFTVRRYATVHQMTSEVVASTDTRESEVLAALFPCASITGAPKVSAMEIISRVEPSARGFYTGTVGYVLPDNRSRWSVAIRTITVDKRRGYAEYGTGGGIVWDSMEESEHRELVLKARVLEDTSPSFQLVETMLCRPDSGVWLLGRHLERLRRSAVELGFLFSEPSIRNAIAGAARDPEAQREAAILRLLVSPDGRANCETIPLSRRPLPDPLPVALDGTPVDSGNLFLRHKTTYRRPYQEAAARHRAAKEVFLVNERGELTEGTFSTIILDLDGRLVTPSLDSGLLPGCYRAELLSRGTVREATLCPADLERATIVFAANSVRAMMRCRVLDGG